MKNKVSRILKRRIKKRNSEKENEKEKCSHTYVGASDGFFNENRIMCLNCNKTWSIMEFVNIRVEEEIKKLKKKIIKIFEQYEKEGKLNEKFEPITKKVKKIEERENEIINRAMDAQLEIDKIEIRRQTAKEIFKELEAKSIDFVDIVIYRNVYNKIKKKYLK